MQEVGGRRLEAGSKTQDRMQDAGCRTHYADADADAVYSMQYAGGGRREVPSRYGQCGCRARRGRM